MSNINADLVDAELFEKVRTGIDSRFLESYITIMNLFEKVTDPFFWDQLYTSLFNKLGLSNKLFETKYRLPEKIYTSRYLTGTNQVIFTDNTAGEIILHICDATNKAGSLPEPLVVIRVVRNSNETYQFFVNGYDMLKFNHRTDLRRIANLGVLSLIKFLNARSQEA